MTMQVGMQLPSLVFRLAPSAENAFSIRWKDDSGAALDLSATTVRLVIDKGGASEHTFTATNTIGGYSNWSIAAVAALPAYVGMSCRLEFVIGGLVYLMAQGRVAAA